MKKGMRNMFKSKVSLRVGEFIFGLVGCAILTGKNCELRADTPYNTDQDASALVARMLQANTPWLNPHPSQGTFSLLRKLHGTGNGEKLGPYSFGWKSTRLDLPISSQYSRRVGSEVWTPLHLMLHTTNFYSAHMAGRTNWNDLNLIAVDVTFNSLSRCAVGFGGQGDANYSACNYATLNHRILIEPINALPITIVSIPTGASDEETIWQFDTNYFCVNEGFAPRAFDWKKPSFLSVRHEFQISNQEWVFKKGYAWYGEHSSKASELVQTFDLIDLTIVPNPNITIQKSGDGIILSWSTYSQTGFTLESADLLGGPWSTVLFPITSDTTNAMVTLPVKQEAQIYRLKL